MGDQTVAQGGVAFFFDKSVGKAVPRALRQVGVAVEIHDEIYDPRSSVSDETWIEYASTRGLVSVLCDKNIKRHPAERAAFLRFRARACLLGGNYTRREMLRHFMIAWPDIHDVCAVEPAPFAYLIDDHGRLHRRQL